MTSEAENLFTTAQFHRKMAVDLFNGTWTLLEKPDRSAEESEEMIRMTHASRYHWGQVGNAKNRAVGEWQISRVYAILGRPEPSLHHARLSLAECEAHCLGDYVLAYAYEALARATAVAGDAEACEHWRQKALAAGEQISEEDDRELLANDMKTIVIA